MEELALPGIAAASPPPLTTPHTPLKPPRRAPWSVLASARFRNLWIATTLSWFGDFFSYVAMAWLVLQLTGSSLALGTVLVVQALPRAALMVVGGALADRISPRLTMLGSMGLRALAVAPLSVLVLAAHAQMWEVYAISAIFGVVDAFFVPARPAILPRIVEDSELEPSNAVLNVTTFSTMILGPVLGGLIVAAWGIAWAFAADAACFAVGFLFILWLRVAPLATSTDAKPHEGLGAQIAAGLRYAWSDVGIRVLLIVIAVLDFAANGALNVGLPTLAHGRFHAGPQGLGILLGAWGVGATAGAVAGGVIPPPRRFGWMLIAICFWFAVGFGGLGLVPSLPFAATLIVLPALASGAANTYGVSWLQRRTNPEMQGRVMSLVMLASMGLTPIAFAAAGALAQLNPTYLFLIAGGMMLLCGIGTIASRTVRSLS